MLNFTAAQSQALGDQAFLTRLDAGLRPYDARFAALPTAARLDFLTQALSRARELTLVSERGVAAYALGARWMGLGFEQASPLLMKLLRLPMPEDRKVHALCEWVQDQLGPAATPASGESALRRSFTLTEPLGRHAVP